MIDQTGPADNSPIVVGSHGKYHWLCIDHFDVSNLLRLCPDVVVGKYLAVTSIDSGPLRITEEEKKEGWWTSEAAKVFTATSWSGPDYDNRGTVAYSPRITSIHGLPNETHVECCDGFDEWWVFEQPVTAGEMQVFVNWGGFRLYDPDYAWCADRLWKQIERLAPESYIGDGTAFTFATCNSALFAHVLAEFSRDLESNG